MSESPWTQVSLTDLKPDPRQGDQVRDISKPSKRKKSRVCIELSLQQHTVVTLASAKPLFVIQPL